MSIYDTLFSDLSQEINVEKIGNGSFYACIPYLDWDGCFGSTEQEAIERYKSTIVLRLFEIDA